MTGIGAYWGQTTNIPSSPTKRTFSKHGSNIPDKLKADPFYLDPDNDLKADLFHLDPDKEL